MSAAVRAVRGATTVERDEQNHLTDRVQELVRAVFAENEIESEDIISMIFTATSDISSKFPASAARSLDLDDVPLLGAQELDVESMLPRCIRVLAHIYTQRSRSEIQHVFLHEAQGLRVDLAR